MVLKIDIKLPKDRAKTGLLFCDDLRMQCYGKSDNETAAKNDNPRRNPLFPWGDIPSGQYGKTNLVWLSTKTPVGEAWIPIEGIGGDALTAKQNGRHGLGIHAGRGSGRLIATYGCLRLTAKDFYTLALHIRDEDVEIEITEGDVTWA